MQVQRLTLGQKAIQGFLAIWLGLVLPLLCVPGISSNHTHGLHWVWQQMDSETEAPLSNSHEHSHSHTESHSHSHTAEVAPLPPAPSFSVGIPTLRSNQIPQAELLVNLFGLMEPVPDGLPLSASAGLVILLGIGWLFRALPPLATPWNPPKAYS